MAKNQKSYTTEFKQQIVELQMKAGKGITELSNEYGFPKGTISTWINLFLQYKFQKQKLFL